MTLFLLITHNCVCAVVRLSQAACIANLCIKRLSGKSLFCNHVFQDHLCYTQCYDEKGEEMIFRKLYVVNMTIINQSASVGYSRHHWQYSAVLLPSSTTCFAAVFSIFVYFIKVNAIILTISTLLKIFIRTMVSIKSCMKSTLRTAVFQMNFTPIYNTLHEMYELIISINVVTIQIVEFIGVKCFLPSCVYYLKLRANIKIVSASSVFSFKSQNDFKKLVLL